MALPPFFDRVYGAVGSHLLVSRESLEESLQGTVVGVRLENDDPNSCWIADMSVNLLARLYPRISIQGAKHYVPLLEEKATSINPQIELVGESKEAQCIVVGSRTSPNGSLAVAASGWCASVGRPSVQGPSNPYASAAAASLAAAELFRRVFTKRANEDGVMVSLLAFDENTGVDLGLHDTDVRDVWVAGVGAVGNGAIWAMSRDDTLAGRFTLIDSESLTLHNMQRYVLGTIAEVGSRKVDIAGTILANERRSVTTAATTLAEYADEHRAAETIMVSVDNVDGRRDAQALLPRRVINGWTGESALGASWHELGGDAACLACLYHPRGQGMSAPEQASRALGLDPQRSLLLWVTRQPLAESDIKIAAATLQVAESALAPWIGKTLGDLYSDAVCGAVPLSLPVVGRIETVPLAHQSVLAGAMMAAELVKRASPELRSISQIETLATYDNVLGPPPSVWRKPRRRETGCICGDADFQSIYAGKWTLAG